MNQMRERERELWKFFVCRNINYSLEIESEPKSKVWHFYFIQPQRKLTRVTRKLIQNSKNCHTFYGDIWVWPDIWALKFDNWIFKFIFFNGNPRLFLIYFRLFKQELQFYSKYMEKFSIQYMVLGFEPTTSRTLISSHNH